VRPLGALGCIFNLVTTWPWLGALGNDPGLLIVVLFRRVNPRRTRPLSTKEWVDILVLGKVFVGYSERLICNSCISEDSSQIFPISLVKIGRLLTDRNFR